MYIYTFCGLACQHKVLETFIVPGYLRSEDGVVWLWHLLVNWEQLQLNFDNSKSEKRDKAIIRIKDKICSRQWESLSYWIYRSWSTGEGGRWDRLIFRISSTRVCMEFDFLSIQVIKSEFCLWIFKIFSSHLCKTLQKYLKSWFFHLSYR